MLWHDDDARAAVRLDELTEVRRHRLRVVRHEDALVAGRKRQDLWVRETSKLGHIRRAKVHVGRPPNERGHENLVEVGVRLKADQGQDAMAVRRAAASFW